MFVARAARLAPALLLAAFACRDGVSAAERPAPPFPAADAEAWVGSPQSIDALRGKVVLLDVWTFG